MMATIDPTRIYEIRGQVCQLYCAPLAFTVANNQQVVAATTGYRVRVMGYDAYSDNAAGSTIALLDASGGTVLHRANLSNGITQPPYRLPVIESGYFETTAGNGLFMNALTNTGSVHVYYISYKP